MSLLAEEAPRRPVGSWLKPAVLGLVGLATIACLVAVPLSRAVQGNETGATDLKALVSAVGVGPLSAKELAKFEKHLKKQGRRFAAAALVDEASAEAPRRLKGGGMAKISKACKAAFKAHGNRVFNKLKKVLRDEVTACDGDDLLRDSDECHKAEDKWDDVDDGILDECKESGELCTVSETCADEDAHDDHTHEDEDDDHAHEDEDDDHTHEDDDDHTHPEHEEVCIPKACHDEIANLEKKVERRARQQLGEKVEISLSCGNTDKPGDEDE